MQTTSIPITPEHPCTAVPAVLQASAAAAAGRPGQQEPDPPGLLLLLLLLPMPVPLLVLLSQTQLLCLSGAPVSIRGSIKGSSSSNSMSSSSSVSGAFIVRHGTTLHWSSPGTAEPHATAAPFRCTCELHQ
jgi:hypothetical protein